MILYFPLYRSTSAIASEISRVLYVSANGSPKFAFSSAVFNKVSSTALGSLSIAEKFSFKII